MCVCEVRQVFERWFEKSIKSCDEKMMVPSEVKKSRKSMRFYVRYEFTIAFNLPILFEKSVQLFQSTIILFPVLYIYPF